MIKVRDGIARDSHADPGRFRHAGGTIARRVSTDRDYGAPVRRGRTLDTTPPPPAKGHEGHDMSGS